jgi:hypothetical protein
MVKEGSKWRGTGSDVFIVISRAEVDGNIWVFYRKENTVPPQEFSCFEEAFLARFRSLPE